MFSNTKFWDDLAIQSYKTLLKHQPDNALLHNNLGLAYVRIKRPNKAIRSFQRAIKYNKDYLDAYYHLGTLYKNLDRAVESKRCFNNYTRLVDEEGCRRVPRRKRHNTEMVEKLLLGLGQSLE